MALVRAGEDGTLENPRFERYALLVAEGFSAAQAWILLGGNGEGGSHQYRRSLEKSPVFQARVEELKAEMDEVLKDPVFGPARQAATVLYRDARARGDARGVEKAMDALLRIGMAEDARDARKNGPPPAGQGSQAAGAEGAMPRKPGAPVKEPAATTPELASLKDRLIAKGVPAPTVPEPEGVQ